MLTEDEAMERAGVSTPDALQGRIEAGLFPPPAEVGPAGRRWDPLAVQLLAPDPPNTRTSERRDPPAKRTSERRDPKGTQTRAR